MHLGTLDRLFWAASFLAHLVLLFVLCMRRRVRSFPCFTTFIAANIARTVVLYVVFNYGTKASYFYTYWSLAILDVLLQLCVVYEISGIIFRPLGVWAKDVRSGIAWLVGGSIAAAAGLTSLAIPPTRLWMQAAMIKGNFFSAALISELFVGMIVLSVTAGLPWRTHAAAISQGLGVYSVLDILVETGHSYFGLARGSGTYVELSHVRIVVYLMCVIYWIAMLWRDPPPPRELPEQVRKQVFALRTKLEDSLQSFRTGKRE